MLRTDEIDERIMHLLHDDGRLSNREVARRLDISEGTVRQRLKKLEDAGAIRIGVVVDPVKLGLSITAAVMVTVAPERLPQALDAFAALPEASYVASVTGPFNVFVVMTTTDMAALRDLITAQIEHFRGVHQVEVRPVVRTPKHDYHVISIPRRG
jgi:Lrp/AsnC family transcriptional regulator, regulator for asnA, asnC and gidA